MQASHESHTEELQTVQSQMLQLQEAVASSAMGSMQRLQEVKMSLQNGNVWKQTTPTCKLQNVFYGFMLYCITLTLLMLATVHILYSKSS